MSDEQKKPTSEELIKRAKESYRDPLGDDPVDEGGDVGRVAPGGEVSHTSEDPVTPPPPPERVAPPPPPVPEASPSSYESPSDPVPPFPAEQAPRGGFGRFLRLPISWIIIGLFVAGGFIVNWFTEAKRDDSGAVVEAGEVAADQIQVGDCLILPEDYEVNEAFQFEQIDAVPCSEPHWAEVYAEYPMGSEFGSTFPGPQAIEDFVVENCFAGYETFTGVAYENEATMDITWFEPTPESWGQGDRSIQCAVVDINGGDLVGTMAGQGVVFGEG